MKSKYVILASAVLISVSTFAQKDELKTLKKIYDKDEQSAKDIVEFKSTLTKAEPLVANSTESDKIYFNYYKASVPFMEMQEAMLKPENKNNPQLALKYFNVQNINQLVSSFSGVLDFEKKSGKQIFTKDIEESIVAIKPMLVNYVVALGNQSQFKDAAIILHNIYELDKKDAEKLYYAANYAVNAKDLDLALQYYQELKNINYSGEGDAYFAVNKETKKEESFNTKQERELYIKGGTHEKPRDEKTPSKRGEIYKNIALILVEKGKVEEAKTSVQEARKLNPDDTSLLLTEANIYLEAKDFVTYKKLISEILEKNPNNVELIYNLGVISYNNKDLVNAEKYYLRVIELDPTYANAYFNMSALKIDNSTKLLEDMNKLGNSPADTKKYSSLKKQRDELLLVIVGYLEKTISLDDKNMDAKTVLVSVYNALEMTDKAKALKAKIIK